MCGYICNNRNIEEIMNSKGDTRDTGGVGKERRKSGNDVNTFY